MGARSGPIMVAFATLYAVWGSTFLALALALRSLPPFMLMGARSLAAGFILLGVEWARGGTLTSARIWMSALLGGMLMFVGCHGSLAYAQQFVPSGVAAVIFATVPFWLLLFNFVSRSGPHPNVMSLFGLIPGLIGVALIAWAPVSATSSSVEPAMVFVLLGSAWSWAAGSLVGQRREIGVSAIALAGMQLVCGGTVLLLVSASIGEWSEFTLGGVSFASWIGFGYLTLAGSVIAFTAYLWLLDRVPGPAVTTYTFVTPVIAVLLGWIFLGERLTVPTLFGITLVISSVAFVWHLETER